MTNPTAADVAEMVIALGPPIRRLHQDAEPLADLRPDPLGDALTRKAINAETNGAWLLRNGIRDGYLLLGRASAFESMARFLRRNAVLDDITEV